MVIHNPKTRSTAHSLGSITAEMLVGLAIVATVMMPISVTFWREQTLARAYYYRALAMGIVDGEMEVLAAGEWKALEPGHRPYTVAASAATNLPPGQFWFTLDTNRVRLEWAPTDRHLGGPVIREVQLKQP